MRIEQALKYLGGRCDEAEIYFSQGSSNIIELKKGEIDLFKESSASGYGARAIKGKRTGFAHSNSLDEELLKHALSAARASDSDPNSGLPKATAEYPDIGIFDGDLAELDLDRASELVGELVRPCSEREVIPSSGAFYWKTYKVKIANTHGLEGVDKGTWCSAYLSAVAKNGESSSGFYFDSSRRIDLDFYEIGDKAAYLAKSSLGAKEIGELKANVILRPEALSNLLENILAPNFSADNVQRGRSAFAGKLGQSVFGGIDIVDDGTLKNGLATSRFDGEGVASRKTVLVEKGVLKGFLYDTYTANKEGRESTGNADRDAYASLPYVAPSNLVISGRGKLSEKGLVVHGLIGAHTVNPVSGDFSVETRNAYLDGAPVKKAIISGNIFQLLNNIGGFGRDYHQVSSIYAPSVEFLDVEIVG